MFKVLIVDDEPQIRTGLCTIIPWESFGFVIAGEAADGVEALEMARRLEPDLVITDVKMPMMDGIELSRQLRAAGFPEMPILVLSGYNDFSFAKEAMKFGVADYLLKPVDPEELSGVLEKVYEQLLAATRQKVKEKAKSKSLKNFFLGRLIRGEIYEHHFETAADNGISLDGERFCSAVVSIDRYGEFVTSLTEQEIGLIKFALENMIEEIIGGNGYFFEISEQWYGIMLIGPASLAEPDLLSLAERIVDATLRYAKESLTIAFGSVVHHPAQIRDSYAQAVKALDKRFYFQDEHVFLFRQEDFEEVQGGIRWDLTGLLQAIRQGNTERTREATERLFEPFEQQFVSLDYLKHQIMLTVIRLGKLMEEYHGDWDVFYTGKFNEVERIIRHGDIQLLKAFLSRFTKEICSSVESVRQPRKTENRIHEIVELIESRYQSELNLKELSKMFYINAVYLGQLFRKETGEYFNDYINKVRIREACVLLAETNAAAADIAEQVGYKYVDHFYRHFKQIHGMNPGEYRRRLVGG